MAPSCYFRLQARTGLMFGCHIVVQYCILSLDTRLMTARTECMSDLSIRDRGVTPLRQIPWQLSGMDIIGTSDAVLLVKHVARATNVKMGGSRDDQRETA